MNTRYTPYRDQSCQSCRKSLYILQIANQTDWLCVECAAKLFDLEDEVKGFHGQDKQLIVDIFQALGAIKEN